MRVGLGRNAFLSRTPAITVNGNTVLVPNDYRGDTQLGRDVFPLGENVFFSLLEIPVPFAFLIDGYNSVEITFPDGTANNDSGAVSSLALQLFDFTRPVVRTNVLPVLDDREINITWDNQDSFIPDGGTMPRVTLGTEDDFRVSYATGISNGVEEDLNYVATQIRQLDELGNTVATSAFNVAVPGAAENIATTSFKYSIPTNFATGADGVTPFTEMIPQSAELPAGHTLFLILFMFAGDGSFANANTEIMVGDGTAPVETRVRSLSFDNKARFTPSGGTMPELGIGQTIDVDITYATGINDFVEEDLFYVATFVRQLDETGGTVQDSPFTVVVGDAGANSDTTSYTYRIPETFDGVTPIPNSVDLPQGHQLTLIIFMSTNNNSGFADDNTNIIIGNPTDNGAPTQSRARSLAFDNIADFVPTGETLPRVNVGDVLDVDVTYATGITNDVEEDLSYVAMLIRQFDEAGGVVNTSEFFAGVLGDQDNMATTSFSYEIPDQFPNGDPILDTNDLPAGHKYTLVFFMSVDGDAAFADASTDIVIGDALSIPDRVRSLSFDNLNDFIRPGEALPRARVGDVLDIQTTYSTGALSGIEEDLGYIAMQIRQFDALGGVVNTSEFFAAVQGDAANVATTSFSYQIPATFPDNTPIAETQDLPEGHKYTLIFFMSVDGDSGFANADTDIVIGDLPNPEFEGRTRSLSFDNLGDFIPQGESIPRANVGDTLDIQTTYATGAVNNTEEDLNYIAMQLRQFDAAGGVVNTSEFFTAVLGSASNAATTSFSYQIPAAFPNGDVVANSSDLPEGHKYTLIFFMSVDDDGGFANANTDINIGGGPIAVQPEQEDEVCFPIKTKTDRFMVLCI